MVEPLPTQEAASALFRGDYSQAVPVAKLFLIRCAEIAVGLVAAGERDPKVLARDALWGSAGIQTFVFAYAASTDAPLPSAVATNAMLDGDMKAIPSYLANWLAMSVGVGASMYLGGERKRLVRKALLSAAAIEAGVLIHVWRRRSSP